MKCENNSRDGMRVIGTGRKNLLASAITQEEIEREKKKLRIGKKVLWKVLTGTPDNNMSQYPTERKELKVIGKYRYVVTARDGNTGLIYSMTWNELMVERRKNHGRDWNVV